MAMTEAPAQAPASVEAAQGIQQIDVKAVNRKEQRATYASRVKVYPKRAQGYFRNI